jgi:hypothetical protein
MSDGAAAFDSMNAELPVQTIPPGIRARLPNRLSRRAAAAVRCGRLHDRASYMAAQTQKRVVQRMEPRQRSEASRSDHRLHLGGYISLLYK